MSITIVIDDRAFVAGLKRLFGKQLSPAELATKGAEAISAEAQRRTPFALGALRNSDVVDAPIVEGKGASVRFGFSAAYAKQMDSGWDTPIIRPVKAKALFIPLSRRAAKLGPMSAGARQEDAKQRKAKGGRVRNLIYGRDFVLAKMVRTPRPVKGRQKGPNLYLTGAIEDFVAAGRGTDRPWPGMGGK